LTSSKGNSKGFSKRILVRSVSLWIYTTEQNKAQNALCCRCYVLHFLLY